ncbi:hypothetical protein GCM10027047_19720 [Rhodococcus aerolatus]
MAAAAALMVGLAPAALAQEAPLPPGVSADAVPEVSAAATCSASPQTYVTHPEWGAVPGACATGPGTGSTDKVFVDSSEGETIFDSSGRLVWFKPATTGLSENLQKFTYKGQPVLVYFAGEGSAVPGSGVGDYIMLDSNYNVIKTISMGNGQRADIHEFQMTADGNALMGSYPTKTVDASSVGGPANQVIVDYVAQEVNIETGAVLFEWRASDHVALTDSNFPRAGFLPWDFFHGNSIDESDDGNILISGRHTFATYKINKATGATIWTLGGKSSSFNPIQVAPGVPQSEAYGFCWQHDFREQPNGTYSLFDNGNAIGLNGQRCGPSRGLDIALFPGNGTAKGTAFITRAYHHSPDIDAGFAGSYQPLPNGDRFLGYGQSPTATRLAGNGTTLIDMGLSVNSYRAFTYPWTATPAVAPVSVVQNGSVYASWNGATEVASWQVLAGATDATVVPVGGRQPRTGFETQLSLAGAAGAAVVKVQPYDAAGNPLFAVTNAVTGSTFIQGLAVTAPVGPGSFDGSTLSLPPVNADFLLFGFAPSRATFAFDPATAIPVTSSTSATGSTFSFTTKLRAADFTVGGFSLSGLLGPTCESGPISFSLSSTGDASQGSPLTGTYTIPPFTGCAGTDAGLTAVLSRPGNTISLTLPSGQDVTATPVG